MLKRIRAVKMEMLSQGESELKGTTRLTVEQNTHLTAELEYQSKETEKYMAKCA